MNPRKRPAETQEEAWVAEEDKFVLKQAKKRSALRVKAGRGRPIDFLVVAHCAIDSSKDALELDDEDMSESFVIIPENVFAKLDLEQLQELDKEIETYSSLEQVRSSREYWHVMKAVCKERIRSAKSDTTSGSTNTVSVELDKVLAPKTLSQLETLEKQIKQKLQSDAAIDVDYWEGLLQRLEVFKANAQLRKVGEEIMAARSRSSLKEQHSSTVALKERLSKALGPSDEPSQTVDMNSLDPESSLSISAADKGLPLITIDTFTKSLTEERITNSLSGIRPRKMRKDDRSEATSSSAVTSGFSAFDREVARGLGENEEVFTTEEAVIAPRVLPWADQYPPRKPRSFNRIQFGYEWNKYNQTHYDQDNPPPKVVQGYRFNIFYPDLVDKTKAPTFRIIREGGRRRGQTTAPAGEDDTCVILFTAGAPYQDVAFRIVDREWEYSAKRERGFKSSFEKVSLA